MSDKVISVRVDATDPITAVGIKEMIRHIPDIRVAKTPDQDTPADLAAVLVDRVDEAALKLIRRGHAVNRRPVVLIATEVDEEGVLAAVETGALAILRRAEACPDNVAAAVRAAHRGEGRVPGDVLGELLEQVGRLHTQILAPLGMRFNGMTERETEVLRLVADGLETAEIAERLNYSQRTIKGVLHDVTLRLNLRNRAHAVAYALREGII